MAQDVSGLNSPGSCQICKHLKSVYYEKLLGFLAESGKASHVIRRTNWCPIKKQEVSLYSSCSKWILSKTRLAERDREDRRQQMILRRKYRDIRESAERATQRTIEAGFLKEG